MLRTSVFIFNRKITIFNIVQSSSFLTNAYRCSEAWNARTSSPLLQKVNLEDFYNAIDLNHSSKGVMSAIDVDIFANSVKDASYLNEMRDLIHKLRLTAETGNTLPSTHHAVARNYFECGDIQDLLNILWDPLNYGIFLDEYTANILMDNLLELKDYEKAAMVASLVMLQEDYSNEISCALALYSSYKYLSTFEPKIIPEPEVQPEEKKSKKIKVEEIKIRIKYLRNPYFDDHFDLTDPLLRAGKTLAWISEARCDNLHANLQILGWLYYKKFDKLLSATETLSKGTSPKVYKEVIEFMNKGDDHGENTKAVEECANILSKLPINEISLEDDLKTLIENAINKTQERDIQNQKELFQKWEELRQVKLNEQTERLDKARRVRMIEEKQKELETEEQKLWFFENEENIDLKIESKHGYYPRRFFGKKKKSRVQDEGYIPPEILPKKRS